MSEHSEHIVSAKLYWLIFLSLIIADANTVVALFIATCKASLVVLIFMHVKYTSEKMTKAILLAAIFWLLLLLVLSLTDYSSRYDGSLNPLPSDFTAWLA